MCEGIVEELRGIDLGDQRLNRRSALVMETLAVNPDLASRSICVWKSKDSKMSRTAGENACM